MVGGKWASIHGNKICLRYIFSNYVRIYILYTNSKSSSYAFVHLLFLKLTKCGNKCNVKEICLPLFYNNLEQFLNSKGRK